MTPGEALALLDQVCSQVTLSRADHNKIAEAVSVLVPLVAPEDTSADTL